MEEKDEKPLGDNRSIRNDGRSKILRTRFSHAATNRIVRAIEWFWGAIYDLIERLPFLAGLHVAIFVVIGFYGWTSYALACHLSWTYKTPICYVVYALWIAQWIPIGVASIYLTYKREMMQK